MTFDQYINNPLGKANAVFSMREIYRSTYASKLDKILLRENNKIDYKLFHTTKGEYFIHMKVPSETVEKFYYDVVIKFYLKDSDKPKEIARDLKKYDVKFFSNDPAFVYTYAHTFIDKDLFVDELTEKMSKQAVKKAASVRNPDNIVGYVKSIFFCYLIMVNKNLFSKEQYRLYGKKLNKKELLSNIEHADVKIQKRQEEAEKQKKRKTNVEKPVKPRENKLASKATKIATGIKKTPVTKKIGTTKKSKYITKK